MPRLAYAPVVLMVLAVALGGCDTLQGRSNRSATYRHVAAEHFAFPEHYVQFDAAVSWIVRRSGRDLVIDGLFKNLRYDWMNNMEMRVAAIDPAGKTVARSVALLFPTRIRLDEEAPFSLRLTTPPPGSKLRFTYVYAALSGAGPEQGGGDTGFWMQSFDARIPDVNE